MTAFGVLASRGSLAPTRSNFLTIFLFFKVCKLYLFPICKETLTLIITEDIFSFVIHAKFSFNY